MDAEPLGPQAPFARGQEHITDRDRRQICSYRRELRAGPRRRGLNLTPFGIRETAACAVSEYRIYMRRLVSIPVYSRMR